jgi:hypothetical protein
MSKGKLLVLAIVVASVTIACSSDSIAPPKVVLIEANSMVDQRAADNLHPYVFVRENSS